MRYELDELDRINRAGDRYGHITPGVLAELIEEVRRLREAIRLQANAVHTAMDANTRASSIRLELAEQARAESSPEVLASERAMNAMLTEENEALRAELNGFTTAHGDLNQEVVRLREDAERYLWLRNRTRGQATLGTAGTGLPAPAQWFEFPIVIPLGNIMKGSVAEHLDEAIDAVRAKEKP